MTLRRWATGSALVAFALLATSCASTSGDSSDSAHRYAEIRTSPAVDGWRGAGLDTPYVLPNAQFTDTDGVVIQWPEAGLPWPVTVVLFGYTNCPDVCTTQLAEFTAARRGLSSQERDRVGLILISTDPERDDAASMRRYLNRFDPSFVGLIPDEANLAVAADALAVGLTGIEPIAGSTDAYEVGHGAQLIGFGSQGTAQVLWLPGTSVADIRADLERLSSGR
jgi:protein SCO1